MLYKKGDKVIIDDKKIIKEYAHIIKTDSDPETVSEFKRELKKFKNYIRRTRRFVIKDKMWESPTTLCTYYKIGYWWMHEDNILGIDKNA
jgi:hypothetical protein